MMLIPDWSVILRKAWSMRLMALSGLFTVAEVLLPMFPDMFPRGVFAALSGIAVLGGMIMRCTKQKDCP